MKERETRRERHKRHRKQGGRDNLGTGRSSRLPNRHSRPAANAVQPTGDRGRVKTLSKLLKERAVKAVSHGFRPGFRDWAAEETNHPREVVEAALAHAVKDTVEAAYARSTLSRRTSDDFRGSRFGPVTAP